MRRHGRRDGNHSEIVRALRFAGCSVMDLADLGNGRPDLLVGRQHKTNRLIEVKVEGERLTKDEAEYFTHWKGEPIMVVRSIEEALQIMGLTSQSKNGIEQ